MVIRADRRRVTPSSGRFRRCPRTSCARRRQACVPFTTKAAPTSLISITPRPSPGLMSTFQVLPTIGSPPTLTSPRSSARRCPRSGLGDSRGTSTLKTHRDPRRQLGSFLDFLPEVIHRVSRRAVSSRKRFPMRSTSRGRCRRFSSIDMSAIAARGMPVSEFTVQPAPGAALTSAKATGQISRASSPSIISFPYPSSRPNTSSPLAPTWYHSVRTVTWSCTNVCRRTRSKSCGPSWRPQPTTEKLANKRLQVARPSAEL